MSGRGSNFRAIHGAIERGELPAEIAMVVSNVPEAAGVVYAREKGLPVFAETSKGVPRAGFGRASQRPEVQVASPGRPAGMQVAEPSQGRVPVPT